MAHNTDESLDHCSDNCTDPKSGQCGERNKDGSLAHRTDDPLDQCRDHCTDPQSGQYAEAKRPSVFVTAQSCHW